MPPEPRPLDSAIPGASAGASAAVPGASAGASAAVPGAAEADSPGARSALALLFLVYLFNFVDRQLIFILFGPIKAEMKFTELQLAALGGTSFVLFYTTLGIPFGRLADRVSRTRMIAAGLAVWSLASALTGAMHSFAGLFACRVVVGIGEATLGPAALSLLSDLFSAKRRATVSAAFSAGIPLGAGVAMFVGGLLGERYGWRAAFYWCGLPGLLLAVLVLMLGEPQRGAREQPSALPKGGAAGSAPAGSAPSESAGAALLGLLRIPALWRLVLGYAVFAIASQSLSIWVPRLLTGAHGIALAKVGPLLGTITATAGLLGVIAGGWLSDRLRANGRGGRLRFSALAALVSAPLWVALLMAHSLFGALVPFAVLMMLGLAWLGPAAADVQDLAGPQRRGIAIGAYFFLVNLIGYGIAPPIIGALSDALGVAKDPNVLRSSLMVCPAAALVAAAVLYGASRRLERVQAT